MRIRQRGLIFLKMIICIKWIFEEGMFCDLKFVNIICEIKLKFILQIIIFTYKSSQTMEGYYFCKTPTSKQSSTINNL